MEEIPSTSCQGNNVTNIVLIPDQTGDPNSAAVAALQQQIIAIVTDAGQQVTSPTSSIGTIFHDMSQDMNSTFTQAMTTLQQPMMHNQPIMQNQGMMQVVSGQALSPLAGHVHTVTEVGENTDATLAAFEAISVLADASNCQVHGEAQDLQEKKVYSSVKASLSRSLVSAIVSKSGSLESVLTNIATQLSIQNILCEYDEGTGIYTLDGDIKELGKLHDVLIHYYDENLDFNLENISPSKALSESKDQGVDCNILRTSVTKLKSGRPLNTRTRENSYDNNDAEYEDEGDDEYIPTIRNKRQHLKRKREPAKKLRELILEFPGKASTSRNVSDNNMSIISDPDDNFTSILGPVSQTVDHVSKLLKFPVEPSLLVAPKLEPPDLQEETMPAQSNEDVVSLLEKPLEGDDATRGFINISNLTGVVQEGSVEAEDFAKYVNMDENDLLGDGTSVLGGDVEKPDLKSSLDLPPVTLSDEEAMAAMEREEVDEKIRVAKEKVVSVPLQTSPDMRERKPKKRKDYDSLMPYKYHCAECSFKSKRDSHYTKHMKIHKDNPELTILKCKVCNFKTIRQCHLKRHQAEHSAEILQCDQCSYKTTDEDLLKKHTAAKHMHGKPPTMATLQHCPKCSYKTTRPYHFERHLRVHADILGMLTGNEVQSPTVNLVHSYQCPKCPYHTKKKEHFVRHLGDVHSEHRPFLCDTCGKSFKRADALKQHRDVHVAKTSRMLPYTCVTCKKSFKSKAHMNDHKTMHTNVRAYLCEICGASFKTKSVQRKHIMSIHRNPRAYHCPHCDKRFNTKFALKRHSTTHMVPDGLIRTTDVPMSEQEVQNIDGQQETQYIQVEVNPSSQLTTIQTIPIMQMESAQVQDVIMRGEDTCIEQPDGTRLVQQMYSGPGEATTALLYLTAGTFPGSY